jgi:hypothetical protein
MVSSATAINATTHRLGRVRVSLVRCGGLYNLDWSDEPITKPRNCFDVLRLRGRIADGCAELFDRSIQALLEVHERLRGPELVTQFFAGDEFPWLAEKPVENLKWLRAQLKLDAVLEQLVRPSSQLKRAEEKAFERSSQSRS